MSDDYNSYDSRKRKQNANNYKGGKGTKVYFEVKQQGDDRGSEADRNYDREDDGSYQSKSNGNNYRQSNRQYDNNYKTNSNNNYYKNNGYNNKSSKQDQQVYQKKNDHYTQSSKEDGLERNGHQKGYNEGYKERTFVRWDDGGNEDIFESIDMKSRDAELRGKKSGQFESRGQIENTELKKDRNNFKLPDQNEKLPEWDATEDGEFSNVDMIFEQKMKSNLVTFDEDDDLLAPKTGKANQLEDDEDEAPVWGDVDADEVRKTSKTMDSVFFKNSEKQNRSTPSSQSTLETSYSSKDHSQNSRFEKVFSLSDETSPLDPRVSGTKMPMNHSDGNQQFSFEQQQEYIKQMQKQAFEMGGGMRYGNGNPQMQQFNGMNGFANGGNKMPNPNMMYSPYQQQQQHAMYNQQLQQNKQHQMMMNPQQQQRPLGPVKVFEKFSGPNYDKKLWYYIDRSGKKQGPFNGKEMDEWHRGGYLPDDLVVTFGENNGFRQLIELVKKVEEMSTRPPPPQQQQQFQMPNINKLLPNMPNMPKLSNLSSFQLSELMKNPDFVQNAKKSGCNLKQLMHTLIEREAHMQTRGSYGYNQNARSTISGTFDSQGVFYPINIPQPGSTPQYYNTSGLDEDDGDQRPETVSGKQDMSQDLNGTSTSKGSPTQQQQTPYQYTNVYGNNVLPQNSENVSSTQVDQAVSSNSQPNGGADLTDQLRSLLGVNGELGGLIGGGNESEQGIKAKINSTDFPPLN